MNNESEQSKYLQVLNRYGESAVVWLVTFSDGAGWEQTVYVITPNRQFAVSTARALTIFDSPRLRTVYKHSLSVLEPAEVAEFIGPQGTPQNIVVFDAESED